MSVLDVLGNITGSSIRAIAQSLFKGFYELGVTANDALTQLREQGLGYRRQDFLRDFREGLGDFEQYTKVRYVNLDSVPSEGILGSKYFGVPDRYSFTFRVSGRDTLNDEQDTKYFMFHRNSLASRRDIEEEAKEWYSNISDSAPNFEPDHITLIEGYINPTWG